MDALRGTQGSPVPPAGDHPAAAGSPLSTEVDGETGRVLVVDDEPLVTRSIRRILQADGYLVDCAVNATDAEGLMGLQDYDLVVSDVGMPGRGGIELLRAIHDRWPDVPVVLVTGTPDIDTAVRAFEYGAFHYLIKPVEGTTLVAVAQKALRTRRLALVGRRAAELLGREIVPLRVQRLEAGLRRALRGLWVAFQPIVEARAPNNVYGHEALLRSEEPSLPTPQAVIEAAERLGRMTSVGRRVRARVAEGMTRGTTSIFVNVHPVDLMDPQLLDENAPLAPWANRVVLEVTERASLEKQHDLRRTTAILRERGYRIAIDDLGSGFSGLNSFALLEPDVVKIDMGLVRDVHLSRTKQKLIGSIVAMAHDMNIVVVAEGVESSGEHSMLAELGCDLLQGYWFSRPGPRLEPPGG